MSESLTLMMDGCRVELLFTECSPEWKAQLVYALNQIVARQLLPSTPILGHAYPSGMVVFLANGAAWFICEDLAGAPVKGYTLRQHYVCQPVPVETANWN